jgi:hypothetical protein
MSPEMARAAAAHRLARGALDHAVLTADLSQMNGWLLRCRLAYDRAFAEVQRLSARERQQRLTAMRWGE